MPELPRARRKCVWGEFSTGWDRGRLNKEQSWDRCCLPMMDLIRGKTQASNANALRNLNINSNIEYVQRVGLSCLGDDGYKTIIQGKSQGSCTVHNVHKAFLHTKYKFMEMHRQYKSRFICIFTKGLAKTGVKVWQWWRSEKNLKHPADRSSFHKTQISIKTALNSNIVRCTTDLGCNSMLLWQLLKCMVVTYLATKWRH